MVQVPDASDDGHPFYKDVPSYSTSADYHQVRDVYWWEITDHDYDVTVMQLTEPTEELEDENVTIRICSCVPQIN